MFGIVAGEFHIYWSNIGQRRARTKYTEPKVSNKSCYSRTHKMNTDFQLSEKVWYK